MREAILRRWRDITSTKSNPAESFATSLQRNRHVVALAEFVRGRVLRGWNPFFLTFQFQQLPGSRLAVLRQMRTEIEAVYRKLVSRVQRFPTTRMGALHVPVLLASADLPVFKRSKTSALPDVLNGGLHQHAIILLPPRSRLREDLGVHFERQRHRYLAGSRLAAIFALPMNDDLEKAIRYSFKAVESGRLDYDESVLVLPRTLQELP